MTLPTPDMIEQAANAIGDAWDCPEEDDDRMRVYARAALEAVLPMLVEECAKFPYPEPDIEGGDPDPNLTDFQQGYVVGFADAVARSRGAIRLLAKEITP